MVHICGFGSKPWHLLMPVSLSSWEFIQGHLWELSVPRRLRRRLTEKYNSIKYSSIANFLPILRNKTKLLLGILLVLIATQVKILHLTLPLEWRHAP